MQKTINSPTIYGYVRVSTNSQNRERQIINIKTDYPEAIIYAESYTGTTLKRPKWIELNKIVSAGDTIVFDEVSRMSRNAAEGFEAYKDLFDRGVNLVFLKQPQIDTSVYKKALEAQTAKTGTAADYILEGIDRYMLAVAQQLIEIAFQQAEKEVRLNRERTIEGIKRARAAGKQIGRPAGVKLRSTKKSATAKPLILKHAKVFGGSLTDPELIQLTGLNRNTYYKFKKELKQEHADALAVPEASAE